MIKNILNLGDAAVYCDFGKDVNQEINTNVINYFKNIKDKKIEGITNITPSYNKLIKIPVCCEKDFKLDYDRLEKKLSVTYDKILEIFFSKEYFCYMTGFIAGMPFLGNVSEKLRVKRLETPRVKVPKGSVGLTEQFCNIYTYESPGGWNIIGNTPLEIFNKENRSEPALINPGDKVKFNKITKEEYDKIKR